MPMIRLETSALFFCCSLDCLDCLSDLAALAKARPSQRQKANIRNYKRDTSFNALDLCGYLLHGFQIPSAPARPFAEPAVILVIVTSDNKCVWIFPRFIPSLVIFFFVPTTYTEDHAIG